MSEGSLSCFFRSPRVSSVRLPRYHLQGCFPFLPPVSSLAHASLSTSSYTFDYWFCGFSFPVRAWIAHLSVPCCVPFSVTGPCWCSEDCSVVMYFRVKSFSSVNGRQRPALLERECSEPEMTLGADTALFYCLYGWPQSNNSQYEIYRTQSG